MKRLLKIIIRRNRNTKLMQLLRRLSDSFLMVLNCDDIIGHINLNGELRLMETLSSEDKDGLTVFDVGANRGDWSSAWLRLTTLSNIYCFEVVKPVYEKLEKTLQNEGRVKCCHFGLSDGNFETEVAYLPNSDSGSSLNVLPWNQEMIRLPATLRKGEDYVREQGIREIFFLKIDTEGHEFQVLLGMRSLLEKNRIKCIQFEYGYTYIQNSVFLKDIYEMLRGYGYSIGCIYPEGINFKEYNVFKDEDFRMRNYFATCDSHIRERVKVSTANQFVYPR